MHQLGQLTVSEADAVSLRDELEQELASAAGSQRLSLADAVAAAAAERLASFKEQFGVLHLDAAAHVRENRGRLHDMWVELYGGADETFPRSRTALEALLKDRHRSALLYFTDGGGWPARPKDGHDMATLLKSDCLVRLLDAVTATRHGCMLSPEYNLACSWVEFLSKERREAEECLGFKPNQLSR